MSWAYDTPKSRDGGFRNLLGSVHALVDSRAEEIFGSAGASSGAFKCPTKGGLVDLLYLMVWEHALYRRRIRKLLGDYYEAADASQGMMIDQREQIAEHLAAARAEFKNSCGPIGPLDHGRSGVCYG
jgi:hypothetical protein